MDEGEYHSATIPREPSPPPIPEQSTDGANPRPPAPLSTGESLQERLERQKRVREIVRSDDPLSWDLAWKENLTPWDMGRVQPSLQEVIEESGIAFPQEGRALVPGCGTGYDVFYLAQRGLKTTGMDISETAVEAANAERKKQPQDVIDKSAFIASNFFKASIPDTQDRFDLVVDHTFFVAIPPALRPAWASQMASLTKPGAYLICIVFPIVPQVDVGPPYFVRPEHYEQVLGGDFVKVWDEVPTKSAPTHVGKERVVVWQRNLVEEEKKEAKPEVMKAAEEKELRTVENEGAVRVEEEGEERQEKGGVASS